MRMTSHLTLHNLTCAHISKPYISPLTSSYLKLSNIVSQLSQLSQRCYLLENDPISLERGERAYLCWLTDADYSSPSYQSQGGVWENFSPTTVSSEHITSHTANITIG